MFSYCSAMYKNLIDKAELKDIGIGGKTTKLGGSVILMAEYAHWQAEAWHSCIVAQILTLSLCPVLRSALRHLHTEAIVFLTVHQPASPLYVS